MTHQTARWIAGGAALLGIVGAGLLSSGSATGAPVPPAVQSAQKTFNAGYVAGFQAGMTTSPSLQCRLRGNLGTQEFFLCQPTKQAILCPHNTGPVQAETCTFQAAPTSVVLCSTPLTHPLTPQIIAQQLVCTPVMPPVAPITATTATTATALPTTTTSAPLP
jgi:hypothetical protein